MGAIFMLHHVRPQKEPFPGFHPNSCLETTPEFLDAVLDRLRVLDFEFVSLRDAVKRIESGDQSQRFAAFTIDDGYLDNRDHALPLFQKYACPFTVFAATKIIDGDAELWWLALEQVVAGNDSVTICLDGRQTDFETRTAAEKQAAYDTIYWTLRAIPEAEQRRKIRNLCSRYGIDLKQLCRREAMTWEQLRQLADDPLVTIGAHTVNHVALGKLPQEQALWEITASRKALEKALGRPVDYFCYPYGDAVSAGAREFRLAQGAGMTAAVTTRKGLIYPEHADHLFALPRVSLNGDYQSLHFIDLYLSGAPFALWNRFRRVDAA